MQYIEIQYNTQRLEMCTPNIVAPQYTRASQLHPNKGLNYSTVTVYSLD